MIKDAQGVEKGEIKIGQAAVVPRGVGKVFDVTDDVIAGVTDGAADERGQSLHGGDAVIKVRSERIEGLADSLRRVDPSANSVISICCRVAAKRRTGEAARKLYRPTFSPDHTRTGRPAPHRRLTETR